MSQKLTSDGAQKGFAVGRGLLAAAETLNYSMGESHSDSYGSSSQQLGGMVGLGGGDGQDHDSQLPRRVGSHLSNTMKLFASLGLSPTDLDVLAQVPEENISVETLPHLIMQLKNRKVEASRHLTGDLPSLSPDTSYRGGRDDWGDMQGGRLDRSVGQSQSRTSQSSFGYGSMQDVSTRGYDMLDYGSGSSSSRDRQYSELSTDHYRGLGMGSSSTSDDLFMQRRMGAPSQGKIQDFLGVMPQMFPHVCSLCDFDVHSAMEWTQHTTGMRHAENRRVLLQLYPDWDPHMPSGRMSGSMSLDTKGRSEGLLGAAPSGGMRQRTGMSSNWGADSGMGMTSKMQSYSMTPKVRSRVVVVKYERKPVLSNLFALARPFGTIREHLVLKNKAFLELQTHEEALAMSNYYQKKPATLHGKDVQIYISKELLVIEKSDRPDRDSRNVKGGTSPVVFFSNLPRETEKKMELLTISRRFGTVEKHLFLNDEAFVQMSNAEDAEMLVKYYTLNPLTIGRRSIRLNICTKYKTLTVPPGKGDQPRHDRDESSRKSSSSSSSRTGSKTSSKSPRTTSSKSKERSSEKTEEPKPEKEDKEVLPEGSGDEGEGVVEAHDEEEEAFDEGPGIEETNFTSEAEEAGAEQPDPEVPLEYEGSAMEPAEDDMHDAEGPEMPEEADLEQEAQSEEPAEPEADQENTTEDLKDTEGLDDVEQAEGDNENEDFGELEGLEESDFPENMDEFVTLDELAEEDEAERHDSKSGDKSSSGRSRESGGLRVVNVVGFKRGYGYLDEILSLAKPFGKVVRHLVLNVRPEAFLELSSEQEARAMVRFYNGNVMPSVCGKAVKIYHSQIYPTIQNGKVVYIGHIPPFKTSDASLLKIAEPFGKVRRYFLNRARNECFIEMERGEDAERFVEVSKDNPPKFQGKRLVVYISRKYKQLKHGHRPPTPEPEDKRPTKRERSEEEVESQESSPVKPTTKKEEEPPTKKMKEETSSTDKAESEPVEEKQEDKESKAVPSESVPEVKKENTEENSTDTTEAQEMETKPPTTENDDSAAPSAAPCAVVPQKSQETNEPPTIAAQSVKKPETTLATLGPYEPNTPVGVEFVKMGYYCRVCFLFYSNEETAKKVHCSSQAHYDKLKKHLEKEKAKTQSNAGKN
ncbi:matrin 3-like 1.2 isoform X2 [Colossoma macropomum]|uniref:matrin 3-like 1.2 isoform X2 n=1 Tax=Colossoma macropomum TaxID=42526 RepID=UPI001864D09D|nr:matrin 3-like 1.2 isoform X2 [Colossoma macropomum]